MPGRSPVIASVDCVPVRTRSNPPALMPCAIAYAVAHRSDPARPGSESITASSAPIASALRTTSRPLSGAIEKIVTVEPSASLSRNCSAASIAYSSNGLSTVSTPVRTRRFVAGSMRLSAFVSGTSFTVTTIFKPNSRHAKPGFRAGFRNYSGFPPDAPGSSAILGLEALVELDLGTVESRRQTTRYRRRCR